MKNYELTVLFHPDLEMNPDPAIDKVRKTIDQAGGKIINEENEGKKRLSYRIGEHDFALYYYMDISLPSNAPGKISSVLNISDEVIRFLIVRTDDRKAKYAALRAEAEAHDSSSDSSSSEPVSGTNAGTDNTNKEDK